MKFLVFGLLFLTAVYVAQSRHLVKRDTTDTTKDDLQKSIEALKKQAEEAIKKLVAEGKGKLAEGIKKVEEHLVDLEAQLEKLNPQTDVGKALLKTLETLIKGAETKLEEEIKKLSGGYYAEDEVKKAIMSAVDTLLKKTGDAFDQLAKTNKAALINGLEKVIKLLKDVGDKLMALKPDTDLGKDLLEGINGIVKAGEEDLEAELKKAQGYYADDTLRAKIEKQVDDVLTKTRKTIDTLTKTGKPELIKGLKQAIEVADEIAKALDSFSPSTDIGKDLLSGVNGLVTLAKAGLEAELKKVEGFYYDDTTKDDLQKSIDALKKQAEEAIKKLVAEGKGKLAEGIKKVEEHLVDLEAQLEKLNPQTDVGKALLKTLETLIKGAETKLEEEIKKLSGGYYADDEVKKAVMKAVDDLLVKTGEAFEKLEKTNKKELINGLEKVIQLVKDIDTKLKAVKPDTDLGKDILAGIDGIIVMGEEALNAELKKVQGYYADDDARQKIMKLVDDVLTKTRTAIDTLTKTGKPELIKGLKQAIEIADEIEKALESFKPTTDLGKALLEGVNNLAKLAKAGLQGELKKAEGFYYEDDLKTELTKQIEELKKKAEEAIKKLEAEGKTALAEGIKRALNVVTDIEKQLESLNPTTDIGKALLNGLETLLKGAEAKLEEEIKKLSGGYYDDTTKDDLQKSIDALKKQAEEAIKKLVAEGKGKLAEGIKKVEEHLVDLEAQLEKLNPQTDVGKALLKTLETLIKGAETKLEEEIKKLSGGYYDDTTKDDLQKSIDALKKQAEEAIKKLVAEGKGKLAEGIKKVEEHLVDLEAQLEKLNPQTDVGKALLKTLETLIKGAETKLEEEIKKLSGGFQ